MRGSIKITNFDIHFSALFWSGERLHDYWSHDFILLLITGVASNWRSQFYSTKSPPASTLLWHNYFRFRGNRFSVTPSERHENTEKFQQAMWRFEPGNDYRDGNFHLVWIHWLLEVWRIYCSIAYP